MPSHLDRWKAWSQLVFRVNQYDGASDSNKKNFAIWFKMVRLDPTMMVSMPKWHRPRSWCWEGASRFGPVETHNWWRDDDRLTGVLIIGKIGNISHRGDFFMFIPHHKLDRFFYHTLCRTCFNTKPSSTKSYCHVKFFLSFIRWLLPITPIPKELFLHALVIVNPLTYHTIEKKPFIISHVYGGTWRMTHCLLTYILNITPE